MKIYLARDLNNENQYWKIENKNSIFISGLSGNGKSFFVNNIIEDFRKNEFDIVVISDKAKVDYKQQDIQKINTLEDTELLKEFIERTNSLIKKLKTEVENSKYSHIKHLNEKSNLLIVLDELWSISKLDKDLRKQFTDVIELVIRQGRYIGLYIVLCSQIGKITETEIPIRQASVLIIGKTDTKELSESLMGTDLAYSSPLKQGMFFYWDRESKPKIIKVVPEKISIFKRIKKWII